MQLCMTVFIWAYLSSMKYNWIAFLFSVVITSTLSAQPTSSKGKWSFRSYGPGIIKATWQPEGYSTNENISDAVIAKPAEEKAVVKKNGDTIFFGSNKNATLIATHQTDEYQGLNFYCMMRR